MSKEDKSVSVEWPDVTGLNQGQSLLLRGVAVPHSAVKAVARIDESHVPSERVDTIADGNGNFEVEAKIPEDPYKLVGSVYIAVTCGGMKGQGDGKLYPVFKPS